MDADVAGIALAVIAVIVEIVLIGIEPFVVANVLQRQLEVCLFVVHSTEVDFFEEYSCCFLFKY